ncbi:hypothetical protein [Treponema sp. UBA3813]|uniref:hypothetical protein n=1 Tax=Treponema sp. UBA3813 TaxID=1947715 RepID=UPI0025E66E58|nr:hypothetical protein [Treponema sp. UBA3813]
MKKNLKIVAILAAMALTCAFFGCSNENSSDDESNDQSISLSDGDYTLTITQSADLTKQMTTDELAAFNAKNDENRKNG